MSENKEVKAPTIRVPSAEAQEDAGAGPYLARGYQQLWPVDVTRLNQVAATKDGVEEGEFVVYTPIGAVVDVHLNHVLRDAIVVPAPFIPGTDGEPALLAPNQIPLMIDNKPPAEEQTTESLVGRVPTVEDLYSSASGQEKAEEQVLAIPTEALLNHIFAGDEENKNPNVPTNISKTIFNNLAFVRRGWCETDTRFLQFLPYVYYWKHTPNGIEIFTYQRGKQSGEGRLAGDCSIGTGGHVNPIDFFASMTHPEVTGSIAEVKNHARNGERILAESFWGGIINSILREAGEEVRMYDDAGGQVDLIDLLNVQIARSGQPGMSIEEYIQRSTTFFLDYKANDVEKVHLGLFIGIEVPQDFNIDTSEEVLHDVGFRSLDVLYHDKFQKTLPSRLECWSRSLVESIFETLEFCKANADQIPSVTRRFHFGTARQMGIHGVDGNLVAKIPQEDRWKIGTLAGSMNPDLSFYAMNMFIRA